MLLNRTEPVQGFLEQICFPPFIKKSLNNLQMFILDLYIKIVEFSLNSQQSKIYHHALRDSINPIYRIFKTIAPRW